MITEFLTTSSILNQAESMNHNERCHYMMDLGKQSISDPKIASSLQNLSLSKIHYERVLALMSALGSFNKEIIARLLNDPSSIGMGAAIQLAAKHLDSELLIQTIPNLCKRKCKVIIKDLFLLKRTDIIEQLYLKSNFSHSKEVLFYTSEPFFTEHINREFMESLSWHEWCLAAKHYPLTSYKTLTEILEHMTQPSYLISTAVSEVLSHFYKTAPTMGLALLKQAIVHISPRSLHLDKYFCYFPEDIAQLLLDNPYETYPALSIIGLRKLSIQTLCSLAQKNIIKNLNHIIHKLKIEQRTAIYDTISESYRNETGAIPLDFIKIASKSTREKEAYHAYHLKLLSGDPMQKLTYLGVLPFEQALLLAEPYLNQPEGDFRAAAIAALIETGRYHAEELDTILDFCMKRKNEQDPVRLAMMNALSKLPPSRWSTNHLPKIKTLIADALKVRDCSYPTMNAAAQLLLKLLMFHTDFVTTEITVLMARMGELTLPSKWHLSNANILELDKHLTPLLKTWLSRERHHFVVRFISSLGRNFTSVYKQQLKNGNHLGFVQLLKDMTSDRRDHIAELGLKILSQLQIKHDLYQLIPKLLEQDTGWIRSSYVSEYLHQYQQNLLTPFLKPQIYKHRFSSKKTPILLSFDNNFFRWTAAQQKIYATAQENYIHTNKRNAWELYRCIHRLSAMPSIDIKPLITLAKLNANDGALRDKALESLGRADAGRGVIPLIEALEDDRARIAIYALRHSIMEMQPIHVFEILSGIPRNKVTVIKEIIRLAGEFHDSESYQFLLTFAKDQTLHPDARIALMRAFWNYLDKEEVWTYFHDAATSSQAALARSTIRIPQEGLTSNGKAHLCKQIVLLLNHEDALVRKETLNRLVSMPLGITTPELFKSLSNLLLYLDTAIDMLAAEALIKTYILTEPHKLVECFSSVTRPKSVAAIVEAFSKHRYQHVSQVQQCADALSIAMLKHKLFPTQALKLALLTLSPDQILSVMDYTIQLGLFHAGVVESNLSNWMKMVKLYSRQESEHLESTLRTSEHVEQRRLGLALLMAITTHYGWADNYEDYLIEYKQDTELWVSEAAGFIEPPQRIIDMSV